MPQVAQVFYRRPTRRSMNVLVLLVGIQNQRGYEIQGERDGKRKSCGRKRLEKIIRIDAVERIFENAHHKNAGIVKPVAAGKNMDRLSYDAFVIVHHRCEFLRRDEQPYGDDANRYEPIQNAQDIIFPVRFRVVS